MTEKEKIVKYNHYIMKKYLALFYPKTKDSLYREFCINYSEELDKTIEIEEVSDISTLFSWYIDETLLEECNEIEGRKNPFKI